ncbi:hypothetical protein WA158_006395 [Blastocystis sp. Blastoise]
MNLVISYSQLITGTCFKTKDVDMKIFKKDSISELRFGSNMTFGLQIQLTSLIYEDPLRCFQEVKGALTFLYSIQREEDFEEHKRQINRYENKNNTLLQKLKETQNKMNSLENDYQDVTQKKNTIEGLYISLKNQANGGTIELPIGINTEGTHQMDNVNIRTRVFPMKERENKRQIQTTGMSSQYPKHNDFKLFSLDHLEPSNNNLQYNKRILSNRNEKHPEVPLFYPRHQKLQRPQTPTFSRQYIQRKENYP